MVFVPMSDEHADDALGHGFEIAEIWANDVDSVIIDRERRTAVHDENTVRVFEGEAVHSDFPETTEGNDAQLRGI
jgi:hypothetical protein